MIFTFFIIILPELPEVTTTVNGLNKVLKGLFFRDVWSDYYLRTAHKRTDNIKNEAFFKKFRKEIVGEKFLKAERRGKNILINLSHNKTILIHMKMTGHLLYGTYKRVASSKQLVARKNSWEAIKPESLKDPYNQHIHLVFTLSNGKHLSFSDLRKFAKVTLFDTHRREEITDLSLLGPEPLEDNFDAKEFKRKLLKRPTGKIKQVLMDQTIVAGIGNIYSDEILWGASIHPERRVKDISQKEIKKMWQVMKETLSKGIDFGGDSTSDYRNIYGERGKFQHAHNVYRRTKQSCPKPGCKGVILRKIIGGRSAHFCSVHQK